jgi:hypothetical protein
MTPEGRVKKAIKAWLDARGFWRAGADEPPEVRGWYYLPQNMGLGSNGTPDFMGIIKHSPFGIPFFIEAKAPGGKPTELQKDRHREIRAAGGIGLVADGVSALAELESYLGREIPGTGRPA